MKVRFKHTPGMAYLIEKKLGIELDFISYPQQSSEGRDMRKWIVEHVQPVAREKLLQKSAFNNSYDHE